MEIGNRKPTFHKGFLFWINMSGKNYMQVKFRIIRIVWEGKDIAHGVPKGSGLGPCGLLRLVYLFMKELVCGQYTLTGEDY